MALEQYAMLEAVARNLVKSVPSKRLDSYNVLQMAELAAGFESAMYFLKHMNKAEALSTDLDLLERAISFKPEEGLVLEFGVASGRTINHLAELLPKCTIHGFDWFKGLPETWRTGFAAGTFAQQVPETRANVKLVPGLFEQTLSSFVEEHSGPVSLLHVDCDLYSSTRTIFSELSSRIIPGTVIVFDEYFNYPGWRSGEFKAFKEFIASKSGSYEYLGFVPSHQQVCVRILPSTVA